MFRQKGRPADCCCAAQLVSASTSPILLGFPLHRWHIRVFHLEPIGRSAAAISGSASACSRCLRAHGLGWTDRLWRDVHVSGPRFGCAGQREASTGRGLRCRFLTPRHRCRQKVDHAPELVRSLAAASSAAAASLAGARNPITSCQSDWCPSFSAYRLPIRRLRG
jgi:hypothetical protein